MRLLLIRHGQTPSNLLGLLDTAVPGPGLTDLGMAQAAALPATLADDRIDAIYASSAHRAQLTAAPLASARGLDVRVRAGLREVDAGDLEMLGDDVSIRIYQSTIREWMAGHLQSAMPGGPDGNQVLSRFDGVVSEVVESLRAESGDDGCAALVAHGAILRVWATVRASDLTTVDNTFGPKHSLHNTGMIVVDAASDGGWKVVTWAGTALGGPRLDDGDADGPAGGDPGPGPAAGADPAGSGSVGAQRQAG
jgi:probable phosphoglycerate mutase